MWLILHFFLLFDNMLHNTCHVDMVMMKQNNTWAEGSECVESIYGIYYIYRTNKLFAHALECIHNLYRGRAYHG